MNCQTCIDEAIKNYISKAKKEAAQQGFIGEIVILERANGTGYIWTGAEDDRCTRLKVIDRVWIANGVQLNRGADNEAVCESCSG